MSIQLPLPSEVEKALEGLVNSWGLNSVSPWSLTPANWVCQHISYLLSSSTQMKLKSFLDLHKSPTHTKPCMYLLDFTEILRCDWSTEQVMLSKSKEWCSDRTAGTLALEHPSPNPGTSHWVLRPCFGLPPLLPILTFCPGLLPESTFFLFSYIEPFYFLQLQIHLHIHLCEPKPLGYSIAQKCFH